MERRPHRTAEEQEAAWLDLFRCLVLTAFFLLVLALPSWLLNSCTKQQTAEPQPRPEPWEPRHRLTDWHPSPHQQ
jgi:hypothetical protein